VRRPITLTLWPRRAGHRWRIDREPQWGSVSLTVFERRAPDVEAVVAADSSTSGRADRVPPATVGRGLRATIWVGAGLAAGVLRISLVLFDDDAVFRCASVEGVPIGVELASIEKCRCR